jgi:hypothetical protein
MNIIEKHIQKLHDTWGEAPEGSIKLQKLRDTESLLRNAMLEAMETVLEESVNEDTVWEDVETGEKSIFVSTITDIINKYKQ